MAQKWLQSLRFGGDGSRSCSCHRRYLHESISSWDRHQRPPTLAHFAILVFFRRGGPWGRPPLATCSDVVTLGWGGAPRLHHTLLAGLPPAPGRWPSAAG